MTPLVVGCVRRLWPQLLRGKNRERVSEAAIPFVSVSAKGSCEPREPGVDVVYSKRGWMVRGVAVGIGGVLDELWSI